MKTIKEIIQEKLILNKNLKVNSNIDEVIQSLFKNLKFSNLDISCIAIDDLAKNYNKNTSKDNIAVSVFNLDYNQKYKEILYNLDKKINPDNSIQFIKKYGNIIIFDTKTNKIKYYLHIYINYSEFSHIDSNIIQTSDDNVYFICICIYKELYKIFNKKQLENKITNKSNTININEL